MMKLPYWKLYDAGGDMLARAGFSFAMCGALAGVIYLTAHHGSNEMAAAPLQPGATQTAMVLDGVESNPAAQKILAAVDASPRLSPATVSLPAIGPIPMARVAEITPTREKRPVIASSVAAAKSADRKPAAEASDAVAFETCLPGCESRDPLIAGHAQPRAVDPGLTPSPSDELVQEVSFTTREPSLLGRALDAPGVVYHRGREALTTLVHAAL